MSLPINVDSCSVGHMQAFEDCLCVFDRGNFKTDGSVDMWVMKNYSVADSWTKLKLKVTDQPENIIELRPILVLETTTFLLRKTVDRYGWMVQ